MPKPIEKRLRKVAKKKHLTGERKNAYVYGTLTKIKQRKQGTGKGPRKARRK